MVVQGHRSQHNFGYQTRLWVVDLATEEGCKRALTTRRVTGETIRATLKRPGVRWLRVKTWITSPDLGYQREKMTMSLLPTPPDEDSSLGYTPPCRRGTRLSPFGAARARKIM
jgi:hypothetical protein